MNPGILVLGLLVALGVVAVGAYFNKEARIKRALRKTPRSTIREVRDGEAVKLVGRLAYAMPAMTAPLTGRACALYEVRVKERRSHGKSSHWETVIHEVQHREFLLEDGTGKALVRAVAAEPRVAIVKDAHFRSGTFNDPTPELDAFLYERNRSSKGILFNKNMRYEEGVLEAGEEVAVLGVGRWEVDPDPGLGSVGGGYREMPRRLVIEERRDLPLHVSDDPSTL